ncbi:ribonuclease P/MRP protein subunit POP5 [Dunckerocampus dactyliophorus]|uniref:ribonuclease P/MRP protein subunit POP5 n=1 Tax=Dunckerocampus dactyliophorus TaxID=161453 RepID=UPI0024066A97|nr:ribonuclease P/MRP protein subunit POP5 [Dunckerocampus dactyliophorus]
MVRVKSRYLLCEVHVSDRNRLWLLDDRAISGAVKGAVARIHGDYGAALCSIRFSVKYLNTHTGMVFLRFPKRCYRLLWSALPFITSIETRRQKIPCFLNCLHIGGTIRTCQKFLVRYNTRQLHRMLPNCHNEEERKQIRKAILSCSIIQGAFENKPENEEEEEEVTLPNTGHGI